MKIICVKHYLNKDVIGVNNFQSDLTSIKLTETNNSILN